jgi:hypothetical protein
MATLPLGVLFYEPRNTPISTAGQVQPGCQRQFYLTGSTTLAPVYQDGALTVPFSQSPTLITADGFGRFPPIYLDPSIVYRSQLFSSLALGSAPLEDVDPYAPAPYTLKAVFKPTLTSRSLLPGVISDPDLQITIVPPSTQATYVFEAFLEFLTTGSTGTTPGLDWEINYSGTLVPGFASSFGFTNSSGAGGGQVNVAITGQSLTTEPTLNGVFMRGVFTTSTGGTLAVQWGQANSAAPPTILAAGSVLTAQRIA